MRLGRLLFTFALLVTSTACVQHSPFTPYANLTVEDVSLLGVTSGQIAVSANRPWELEVPWWLTATPSSGFGDSTVTLTVTTDRLEPGAYSGYLSLFVSGKQTGSTPVNFAFPRVRGNIVLSSSTAFLSGQSSAEGGLGNTPGTLLVTLHGSPEDFHGAGPLVPQANAERLTRQLPGTRVRRVYENVGVLSLEVDDVGASARSLAQDPLVRSVSTPHLMELLQTGGDPGGHQWSHETLDVAGAWTTATGDGVTVAVLDTGFYPEHPDLRDQVAVYHHPLDPPADPSACDAHGNHVAGIIAGDRDGDGITGIAPGARLLLVDVSSSSDCRLIDSEAVIAALDWLLDGDEPKARIVNMSFGGSSYVSELAAAIEHAYSRGVTFLAASGNSPDGSVLYPAAFPEVLAVSATGRGDVLASYSTVGPKVYVSGPGGDGAHGIISSAFHPDTDERPAHLFMQGTSMATPAAAGVAALAAQILGEAADPLTLAGVLAASAQDLGVAGRDDLYGYGRVAAAKAVAMARESEGPLGFLVTVAGDSQPVPALVEFDLGYFAPGSYELGATSEGAGATTYAGSHQVNVSFGAPYVYVDLRVAPQ